MEKGQRDWGLGGGRGDSGAGSPRILGGTGEEIFSVQLAASTPQTPNDSWFYIGSVTQQGIASSANVDVFARFCSSFLVARLFLPG